MMTQHKPPPAPAMVDHNDPYKMRTLEQIFSLFDSGDFIIETMEGHHQMLVDLIEHKDQHGSKGCQGTMTIQVSYALGKSGDVSMGATSTFKSPKKPPSNAAAYVNDKGELTLYSPFLARMHRPVREVPDHDPATGEIRDPS